MINLDFSVLVDRPHQRCLCLRFQPQQHVKWNSAVVSLQQSRLARWALAQNSKPLGEMMGRRIEGELQITIYEPDTKCGFQLNAGPMQVNLTLAQNGWHGHKDQPQRAGQPWRHFQTCRRRDGGAGQIHDGRKSRPP
jgi:hypothetical protein